MTNYHSIRINDTIRQLAAKYLQRESNRTSLVTITNVNLYDHDTKATILFTVLPENKEKAALDFAKRHRAEFREYLKDHARLRVIPFVDFDIDRGEKNRQRVDEITINDPVNDSVDSMASKNEKAPEIDPVA